MKTITGMIPVPASAAVVSQKPEAGAAWTPRRIAFTTPLTYAARIARTIELRGWVPYHCPTIDVGPTPRTHSALEPYLLPPLSLLRHFSAIAFTSRNGIAAFAESLRPGFPPLPPSGEVFTVSALGNDAERLDDAFLSNLCPNPGRSRLRVLVPPIATPAGMVQSLGPGSGRKILCPVPLVVDLEEPPVVPDFLDGLAHNGWDPVRVPAYETSWAGPKSAEALLEVAELLDAVVFTSTAEVEGLLKSLKELGCEWGKLRQNRPELVLAAHGPVTAAGAARLGVVVDVVSRRFGSFEGVVDALECRWGKIRPGDLAGGP